MADEYRVYSDLADWWPLISPPAEYADEATHLAAVFDTAATGVREVLDLGSGGGGVAVHLKDRFALTLVDYMTSEGDLRQVIETAFANCRPGGLAVFVPDHIADTFRESAGGGGGSDAAGRQASFREWTWDPDPADDWVQAEYEFVLREADATVQVVRETHRLGAFRRATWLALIAEAGFDALTTEDPAEMRGQLFLGRRRLTHPGG